MTGMTDIRAWRRASGQLNNRPDYEAASLSSKSERNMKQRAKRETELCNRRWNFRDLLDALPAAIYTTDAAGRITFFNQAAVEFSGRTPEIGSDQWCVTWRLYWPDGRPMAHDECPMARALKEDRPIRGGESDSRTARWNARAVYGLSD